MSDQQQPSMEQGQIRCRKCHKLYPAADFRDDENESGEVRLWTACRSCVSRASVPRDVDGRFALPAQSLYHYQFK